MFLLCFGFFVVTNVSSTIVSIYRRSATSTMILHRKTRCKRSIISYRAYTTETQYFTTEERFSSSPPVAHLIPRPLIVSGPLFSPFVTTVAFGSTTAASVVVIVSVSSITIVIPSVVVPVPTVISVTLIVSPRRRSVIVSRVVRPRLVRPVIRAVLRSAIGLHTMISARSGCTSSTSSSMSNSNALAFDILARKLVNCSLRLLRGLHHDKTEATGLLRVGVNHDLNLGNLANLAEQIFKLTLGNGTR